MSSTRQDKSPRSTRSLHPTTSESDAAGPRRQASEGTGRDPVRGAAARLRSATARLQCLARRAVRPARLRRGAVQILALLLLLQPNFVVLGAINAQAAERERQQMVARGLTQPAAAVAVTAGAATHLAAFGAAANSYARHGALALAAGLGSVWETLTEAGQKVLAAVRTAPAPQQPAPAVTTFFGPRKFVRKSGAPFTEVERFRLPAGLAAPFTLVVQNGDASGTNRVSSATIKLNGATVFTQSDFNTSVPSLQRVVTLAENNTLEVKLSSTPGSYLIINVQGLYQDKTAPAVAITSPADGSTTAEASAVVSGTASDPGPDASGVAAVYVNNQPAVYNAATGTWSIANVALAVGANQITARAVDGSGNESIARVNVTRREPPRDTTAPELAISSPADGFTTLSETVVVSGTAGDPGPDASGVAQVTVNGAEAARDVLAGTWTASVALNTGPNIISVRAADKAGNVAAKTITVTRGPQAPVDTKAPTLRITSPQEGAVVFESSVALAGTAVDEGEGATGVRHVYVNGEEAVYNAGDHTWAVSDVALSEGPNVIVVEAEDAATPPNKGRAEVRVTRRSVAAPKLTINNPQVGAVLSTGTVTVAGEVTPGAPDIAVTVKVNGEPAQVAGGQYTKTVTLADGTNTLTVVATDALNQSAQSSVTLISDQKAPSVSLSQLPALVQPGAGFMIRAEAADNVGLEAVDFVVDGQLIATVAKAPYEFEFVVPADAAPDRLIEVTAVARDLTGATAVDAATTRVAGPSGVSGYVFDDSTGYALAGVTASASGGLTMLTPETGVYSFVSSSPRGVARLSKEGYTTVERTYEAPSGGGTALFDARLTRLDQHGNQISPAGGQATGDGGRAQLVFGAGALAAEADVRVTSVSPQGLANLLPFGWSPVPGAVVDVRAAGGGALALQAPAQLTIQETPGLAANTPLVLARYDEAAHVWVVVNVGVLAGANGALTAELTAGGQYAFLVADSGATAPPAAQLGQPLPSAAPAQPSALDSATATAVATPRSAVMSKEARSTISFVAKSTSKLPSGVSVEVTFEETYSLLKDSEQVQVDRPTQDFVLYSYPAATASEPNRLGAFFVAKPTRTDITVAQLRAGNVHVAIRSGRASTAGVLVGAGGGQVTTDDGAELRIGAGALGANTPVFLNTVPDAQVGLALPRGYELVGTVDVDLSGASLSNAGTLAVPVVAGDLSRILVARLVAAGGQRVPKVVARAVHENGKLVSTTAAPAVPEGVALQGVRASGRYIFVRVPHAFGYLTGAVTEAQGGSPAQSARVSVDRTPFADVTGADGRFTVVGAAGGTDAGRNEVIAALTVTDATGATAAALGAQDATAEVSISVNSAPLAVASVSPVNDATDVIATTPVTVTFSKPVMPATVTNSSFRVVTEAGNPVLGSVTVLAGSRVASFTPTSALGGSARYRVLLGAGILDLYGKPLAAPFESAFRTATVVRVDDRLRPELIRVGYPDAGGQATVTVPALAVPVGSVILALNNTSGGTVTAVADASGVTLKIYAKVGDEIVLVVRQPDGAEYRVAQAAYRRPDGMTSVTENGGTVATDDAAVVLDIPKGAITGQAEIKLTPKTEADITTPRNEEVAKIPVKGGVEIRAEGNYTCEKELHLELPAPPDMPEGERVAFMAPRKMTFEGQEVDVWEPVTSGRVEGGKFKTNSPPFSGLVLLDLISWVYVFAPVNKRVIFGRVYENETEVGIKNALVIYTHQNFTPKVSLLAGGIMGRTSASGGYSLFDFSPSFQEGMNVTAIDDTNNRRGSTYAVPLTAVGEAGDAGGYVEGRFLQGLTGFLAARGNIALARILPNEGIKPAPGLRAFARRLDIENPEDDPLYKLNVTTIGPPVRIFVQSSAVLAQFDGQLIQTGLPPKELQWKQQEPGLYTTDLPTLTSEGSYTINFRGATVANEPRATSTLTFNFICLRNPNTRPPLEGPPKVLTTTPADGSTGVDMTGDIRIEFSEPVRNLVPGRTVYIEGEGGRTGGQITSGGIEVGPDTTNISSIIFRPVPALVGGKDYCINVTSEVVDDTSLPLNQNGQGGAFRACFRTFEGLLLTPEPVPDKGDHIAVAGQYAATTYQETHGRFKFTVYDIAEPHKPTAVGSLSLPQWAWSVAMAEDQSINVDGQVYSRIAVVTTSNPAPALLSQPANIWIIDLSDVTAPKVVGVTSLYLPILEPSLPYSVRIFAGRAYIGNFTTRGVMTVDLAESISLFKTGKGRLGDAPDIPPMSQATMPMAGYAHRAKKQSVIFEDDLQKPAAAVSVDVLSQTVVAPSFQGMKISGPMPVVYAADWIKKRLVAVGVPRDFDNLNDFYGPDFNADDRILSFTPLSPEDHPRIVRTIQGARVPRTDGVNGVKTADLAVVFGFTRMWMFDVTMSPTDQKIQPVAYPSRTFAELDPELTGPARNCEVEGTLAYVAFEDRIAVIDFSDPSAPRVIAKINGLSLGASAVAVKDGFVFTLSPETGGLRVSIARPATQVFVHGQSLSAGAAGLTCSNPVVIDRQTLRMRQKAEILFQIFGLDAASNTNVTIFKGEEAVATVPATISPSSTERVLSGRAEWVSDAPIDINGSYSVQVGINKGEANEFHSQRASIPFSFLIAEYQGAIGFQGAPVNYGYVLGANAQVTLEINNAASVNAQRTFGLNVEQLAPPSLPDGRYPFKLRAVSSDDGALVDEVSGIVEIAHQPDVVRRPGNTVVSDVDLGNGSLGLTYTDLFVKNRGLSLSVTRSYNSAAANVFSPFGYGWHHNFQVLLVYYKALGQYMMIGGDGSGQVFKEAGSTGGEMRAEGAYHSKLVKNADGSFDFYTKTYVKYHFPGALERDAYSYYNQAYVGNLEYIEDPNKNRLTLEYDELGLVRQVLDSSQRALKFKYEEAETPFVGVIAPSTNINSLRACARGEQFGILRKGLAKARVGRAWRVKEIEAPGALRIQYKYDPDGNLIEVRRLGSDGISEGAGDYVWAYEYRPENDGQTSVDVRHLLKTVIDPNGHKTGYEYELATLGLPVKTVKHPGADNNFLWQLRNGKVATVNVTDGRGGGTTYEFDEKGYGASATGPRGATTSYSFNERGLKSRETDPEGTTTQYGYDSLGNETSRHISGKGVDVTTRATYDPQFSKLLSQTDFNGRTTSYSLDGRGNTTSATLPTGRTVRMTYGGGGDLVSIVNERGLTTSISYDSYGNPATVTRQVSPGSTVVTNNTYDSRSRLRSVTDSVAPHVAYTYDTHERVVRAVTTDPAGIRDQLTTSYSYQTGGQVLSETHSGGGQNFKSSYVYDGLDRVTGITEEAGGAGSFTRSLAYDGNSNLTSVSDRRGVTTSYEYDGLDFMTKETVTGPFGPPATTSYGRDLVGNATQVTDIYGQTTSVEYDGLRRETARTLPGGYTERRALDGNGNVLSFTDRNSGVTTFAYDPVNRVTLRRDPLGRTETWNYEDDGKNQVTYTQAPQGLRVITQTDELGRPLLERRQFGANDYVTSYAYDGRSCNISDPRGTVTHKELSAFGDVGGISIQSVGYAEEMKYAALGALRQHKDALGRESRFEVDSLNRRTAASYPGGFSESWGFDGEGNLLTHTDRRGVGSAMTYDNMGRPLTRKVGGTTVASVEYSDSALTETRLDAKSQPTVYRYDGLHRVVSVKNPAGDEKSFEYDGIDLLRASDFKRQFTQFQYDAVSRPTAITDRAGQLTTVAYNDAGGQTRTVTDRRGNPRVETYDPLGRLVKLAVGGLPAGSFEYDGNGNRTASADGRGNRTAYEYDALNLVLSAKHAGQRTETFEHDLAGNLKSYDDGRGGAVTMTYDDLDRPKTRKDGEGNTTTFRYDGEGLLLEQTAPKGGFKTSYEYNELRSLKKVTDAAGGVWEFGYDPNQNMTSLKDALGRTVTFGFDSLDRATSVARPMGLNTVLGYDANDNVTSVLEPTGQSVTFGYDSLDRRNSATYPGAAGQTPLAYTYGYDPEGNLVSVGETVNQTGAGASARSYARTYDARNRVRTVADPFGHTVSYDYDNADNVTSMTGADGRRVSYEYDALNRVSSAALPGGKTVGYEWHPDGLLKQINYGSGMTRSHGYDNADRLTKVTNLLGSGRSEEYSYAYDANGNRQGETRASDSLMTRTLTYGYDQLDRLTSVSAHGQPGAPATSLAYTYDAVGNRKTESGADYAGQQVSRGYNYDDLNRLTSATGYGDAPVDYRYDNAGNLLSATQGGQSVAAYEYDARSQLRRVVGPDGQEAARYDYDFERRRLSGAAGGAPERRYVYGGGNLVNEFAADGRLLNRYDYGAGTAARASLDGEGDRWYFGDALGSTTALSSVAPDGVATPSARYEYGAWGEVLAGGGSSNRIGYTGQRLDPETGLMPLGHGERYYSPQLGRFTQQDSWPGSLASLPSLNRYAYAHNNPVLHADPSGHIIPVLIVLGAIALGAAVGGGVGGVVGAAAYAARHVMQRLDGKDVKFSGAEMWQAAKAGAKFGAVVGGIAAIPVVGQVAAGAILVGTGAVGVAHGVNEMAQGDTWTGGFDVAMSALGMRGGLGMAGRARVGPHGGGKAAAARPGLQSEGRATLSSDLRGARSNVAEITRMGRQSLGDAAEFVGSRVLPRLNPFNYEPTGNTFGTFGSGGMRFRPNSGGKVKPPELAGEPPAVAVQQLKRAQELSEMQHPIAAGMRTTASFRVRNLATDAEESWIAQSGVGKQPKEWEGQLNPDEVFIRGSGKIENPHAEQTVFEHLANERAAGRDYEILGGGTTKNVCISRCSPLIAEEGLQLGGPRNTRHRPDKTDYQMFWKVD